MIMSTYFKRLLLASGAVLCLCVLLCGCTPSESQQKESLLQHCDYSPNHFLLSQLATHRAVLLGDSGHGVALYMQTVISFLNYWMDEVEKDSGKSGDVPRKLFLILERDSLAIERIKKYWESGDIYDLNADGGFCNPMFTTANLEYCADLHAFWTRVARHNAAADDQHRVSFEIFGPEKSINISDWSKYKGADFFVHERDEYSSHRVLELLGQHPDWKALLFYGNAHINGVRSLKIADSLSDSGYYLAHYLSEGLEDCGGLYVVTQSCLRSVSHLSPVFLAPHSTYGADIAQLDCPDVTSKMKEVGIDGFIIWYNELPGERPVMSVLSDNLARTALRSYDTWTNMENDFYRTGLVYSYLYLSTISGRDIDTMDCLRTASVPAAVKKWRDWHAGTTLDVVTDIESGAVLNRLLEQVSQSTSLWARRYEIMVAGMTGQEPQRDTSLTPAERAGIYRDMLQYDRRPLMIDHLVNLLWVGTPEECQKARVVLKRETGQDFATAKEWMVWYRQNYRDIWYGQP